MIKIQNAKGCFVIGYREDGSIFYKTAVYRNEDEEKHICHSYLDIKNVVSVNHYEFTANDVVNDGVVLEYINQDLTQQDVYEAKCVYFMTPNAARAYINLHGENCNIYWCRKTI